MQLESVYHHMALFTIQVLNCRYYMAALLFRKHFIVLAGNRTLSWNRLDETAPSHSHKWAFATILVLPGFGALEIRSHFENRDSERFSGFYSEPLKSQHVMKLANHEIDFYRLSVLAWRGGTVPSFLSKSVWLLRQLSWMMDKNVSLLVIERDWGVVRLHATCKTAGKFAISSPHHYYPFHRVFIVPIRLATAGINYFISRKCFCVTFCRKLIKTDIKRRTLAADDLTSSVGMPPAKRITTVGQLLAANSANAKRTSVGSVLSVTGTLPTHNVSPRPLNYQPRPRYNPVTVLPTATPSVATTITLQSSPQPIATTRAIALLPSEPNRHYLDPPGA